MAEILECGLDRPTVVQSHVQRQVGIERHRDPNASFAPFQT
jgi:hypothetical protein